MSMPTKDLAALVPERVTWLRAAVSSIPLVGSAFDHLLFDKADAIRLRNLETALKALSNQVQQLDAQQIQKDWFASEEALSAFKVMADKVSYEPDSKKIDAMGRIIAACGTQQHFKDQRKLSVVEHLGRLSHTQMKLLQALVRTPARQKRIDLAGLEQTVTAIWASDFTKTLKAGPHFWTGKLKLYEELEILESYNTIKRALVMVGPSEAGYVVTKIGKQAASYVSTAGL